MKDNPFPSYFKELTNKILLTSIVTYLIIRLSARSLPLLWLPLLIMQIAMALIRFNKPLGSAVKEKKSKDYAVWAYSCMQSSTVFPWSSHILPKLGK